MLFLVRHGATDANTSSPPILQGQGLDIPLNSYGIQQAGATADLLKQAGISCGFTSPLMRAQQTAQIISHDHFPVEIISEITECDVGDWEGMSWDIIKDQFPKEHDLFMANPAEHGYRGGESFGDVHRRALCGMERLLPLAQDHNILVVTHNIVARVTIAHYLGVPISKARMIYLDNCGVSILESREMSLRLISVNSNFHLPSDPGTE